MRPRGLSPPRSSRKCARAFGAILTDGQGTMKGHMFRVAHLGYFDFLDLLAVLGGLEITLQKIGHKVELGSGVRAAQNVYLRQSASF